MSMVPLSDTGFTDGYGRRNSEAVLKKSPSVLSNTRDDPADYLGKAEVLSNQGESFSPVFVTWNSADAWTPGCGALWFSPQTLGIREVVEHQGKLMVPIASFLWVLDPERLCMPITGEPYSQFKIGIDDNSARGVAKLSKFHDHQQLAQFLEGQIKMFARMCKGRSYNCIRHLCETFRYTYLLVLVG